MYMCQCSGSKNGRPGNDRQGVVCKFQLLIDKQETNCSASASMRTLQVNDQYKSAFNPIAFRDGMQRDKRNQDRGLSDIFLICGVCSVILVLSEFQPAG